MENCTAKSSCLTFEGGSLLPPVAERPATAFASIQRPDGLWTQDRFEVDCLEVWACGGLETVKKGLDAQKLDRAMKQEAVERARKVDKAQFFNGVDAEFLLSNTLSHRSQVDGRADQPEWTSSK